MPFVLGVRYLTTAIRSKRRTKISILDESRLVMRVRPSDCDIFMHMNNGRYLSLMDLGRFDQTIRSGVAAHFRANKWRPVAAGATIRFRRDLPIFSKYTLVSNIAGWDSQWWYFEQRFERKDGLLAAKAFIKVAILDNAGKRLLPPQVLKTIGQEIASPDLPEDLIVWQSTEYG